METRRCNTSGRRYRYVRLISVSLLCLGLAGNSASAAVPSEYQLKAVLISKLVGFIDWPNAARSDIRPFCIVGSDPFETLLQESLQGAQRFRDINAPDRVAIRHFSSVEDLLEVDADNAPPSTSVALLQGCGAVFLNGLTSKQTERVLALLSASPVLTVSDQANFAEQGGMIHLALDRRRVKFRINPQACEAQGIKVSYKLLRLAELVQSQPLLSRSEP